MISPPSSLTLMVSEVVALNPETTSKGLYTEGSIDTKFDSWSLGALKRPSVCPQSTRENRLGMGEVFRRGRESAC